METALNIVEQVAFAESELGVTDIAKAVGVAKGAVHRHLQTLVDRGYLAQNPDTSRYKVGLKFSVIGGLVRPGSNLLTAAELPMRRLRDSFGEAVAFSVPEANGARVVAAVRGSKEIELGVRLNRLLPFEGSAQGRIIVAFDGSWSFLESKPRLSSGLKRELSRAREQGWTDAPDEVLVGMNALAAPVFGPDDSCVGALAIVGLFSTADAKQAGMIKKLIDEARAMSVSIGARNVSGHSGDKTKRSKLGK